MMADKKETPLPEDDFEIANLNTVEKFAADETVPPAAVESSATGAPVKVSSEEEPPKSASLADDRTINLVQPGVGETNTNFRGDKEKTVEVAGKFKTMPREEKAVFGQLRPQGRSAQEAPYMGSSEAVFNQAENLKIAQQRILQLEEEVDRLRRENDELATAGEILRVKNEDIYGQMSKLQRDLEESEDLAREEAHILRESLRHKDKEVLSLREKIEELEARINTDFKKIRVRERELENRLELMRLEKTALARTKDDSIIELKNRVDQLLAESEGYRQKCHELNKQIDANQDQFRRTVRALRLALSNLETVDDNLSPLKKVE
jgi:hypothetical protein